MSKLHELDRLNASDLRVEIERRREEAAPLRSIPDPNLAGGRVIAGVVAVVVFAAAIAVASGALTDRTAPVSGIDPWASFPPGWSELPPPPEWRDAASIVWTGDRLLYWGGSPQGADRPNPQASGFSFDPMTGEWSQMTTAPNAQTYGAGVWTGTEALFFDFGANGLSAQAFDLAKSAWRTFPDDPEVPEYGTSWTWTGRELIVFGGGSLDSLSNEQGWALNPVEGSWRRIANAPIPMNLSDAVWTGTEMVVVGSAMDRGNHATTRTAQAQAYDPSTNTWTEYPAPPVSAQTSAVAFVNGHLIAWETYSPASAEWLPAERRWRSIEMGGLGGSECYASGVAVTDTLFTWGCGAPAAWFAQTNAWTSLEPPIVPVEQGLGYGYGEAYGADDVAVVEQVETVMRGGTPYVGSPDAPVHLWAWRPSDAASVPTWQPTRADAENLVGEFLSDWYPGWEVYLPTVATTDVIDRNRAGTGPLVPLEDWAVRSWNNNPGKEIAPGTFEVTVELLRDHETIGIETFTVGPGTAGDGGLRALVILDTRMT